MALIAFGYQLGRFFPFRWRGGGMRSALRVFAIALNDIPLADNSKIRTTMMASAS